MKNSENKNKGENKMLKTIKGKIKKILAGLAFMSTIYASLPAAAENAWANIQPGYNIKDKHPTVRLESGSDITDKLGLYAYMDLDSTKDKPSDFESYFGAVRLTQRLNNLLGLVGEYEGGNDCEDTVRIGAAITPKLGKGNFTVLRLFPYETSREKGPQVALFVSQKFTDKLTSSLLACYDIDPKNLYLEPELDLALTKDITLFLQGRSFGEAKKTPDMATVAGIKYNF